MKIKNKKSNESVNDEKIARKKNYIEENIHKIFLKNKEITIINVNNSKIKLLI